MPLTVDLTLQRFPETLGESEFPHDRVGGTILRQRGRGEDVKITDSVDLVDFTDHGDLTEDCVSVRLVACLEPSSQTVFPREHNQFIVGLDPILILDSTQHVIDR